MKWLNHKAFIISLLIAWPFFLEGPQICSFLPSIGEGQAAAPAEEWWDEAYQYREAIKVTNNSADDEVPIGYSVWLTFDHATLVSDSKSLESGDDVRVVYWDAESEVWTELDRGVDPCTLYTGGTPAYFSPDDRFDWNEATTRIWFKTQAVIAASGDDDNYYLYYGNDSPAAVMDDYSNLYDLWEGFDYAEQDGWRTNWTDFTEEYYYPVEATIYRTSNSCTNCDPVPAPSDINWTSFDLALVAVSTTPARPASSIEGTGPLAGLTWTLAAAESNGTDTRVEVWWTAIPNASGGWGSVNVDLSDTAEIAIVSLQRWKDADTRFGANPIGSTNTQTGSATNYSIALTTTIEGAVAFGAVSATGSKKAIDHTPGTDYTSQSETSEAGKRGPYLTLATEYQSRTANDSDPVTGTLDCAAKNKTFYWAAVAIEIKPEPPRLPYLSGSYQLRIENAGTNDTVKQGVFHNSFTTSSSQDFAIRSKCRKPNGGFAGDPMDTYLGSAGWYHQAVDTQDQYGHDGPYFYGFDTIHSSHGNSRYFLSNGGLENVYIEQEAPTSDCVIGTWYIFETFVKDIPGSSTHIKVTRKEMPNGDTETYFPSGGGFTSQGDDNLTSGRIAVFNQTTAPDDSYYDWILVRKFVDPEPTVSIRQ